MRAASQAKQVKGEGGMKTQKKKKAGEELNIKTLNRVRKNEGAREKEKIETS